MLNLELKKQTKIQKGVGETGALAVKEDAEKNFNSDRMLKDYIDLMYL